MPGMLFRVDHVVGHVHMEIGRVFVDAAMSLMLGISQCGGKAFFDGPEKRWRQLSLVLGAEADYKVIGLALSAASVHGLNIYDFGNSLLVIIVTKASGAPVHEPFFTFMTDASNVVSKAGIVITLGTDAYFFADHRMAAMAC